MTTTSFSKSILLNRKLIRSWFMLGSMFIWVGLLGISCTSEKNTESQTLTTKSPKDTAVQQKNQPAPSVTSTSSSATIRFYFTPSVEETIVKTRGGELLAFLEKETGLKYEIHITKNYDEMIKDFEGGRADVAIMNSLSYIKVHESCGADAKLRAVRYGKSTYSGQIITREDKGISSISQLNGKTIAYTDSLSTSGYLFPQKILIEKGVKPAKTIFAGKHDDVVKLVYTGKVDAGATFYSEPASDGTIRDARARLLSTWPDIAKKVKILTITEPIPNDPVVFSKLLSQDISRKITLGLMKFVSTQKGKDVLTAIYSTEGFVRCSDADYDGLRAAIK